MNLSKILLRNLIFLIRLATAALTEFHARALGKGAFNGPKSGLGGQSAKTDGYEYVNDGNHRQQRIRRNAFYPPPYGGYRPYGGYHPYSGYGGYGGYHRGYGGFGGFAPYSGFGLPGLFGPSTSPLATLLNYRLLFGGRRRPYYSRRYSSSDNDTPTSSTDSDA